MRRQLLPLRLGVTVLKRYASGYAMGTIVRPGKDVFAQGIQLPSEFKPGSLLLVSTPQYADELYATVAAGNSTKYSVYGAVVDAVTAGTRDGVSFLWTEKPIAVNESRSVTLAAARQQRQVENHRHEHDSPYEARGRFVAKGGSQWRMERHFFSILFGSTSQVRVQAASTLLATGVEAVLVGNQTGADNGAVLYASLDLEVPVDVKFSNANDVSRRPRPVNQHGKASADLIVTAYKDNVIRTINHEPASKFLASLETSTDKEVAVYAVVDGDRDGQRYKVIAGGGQWGARSGMLVLDPAHGEPVLHANSRIDFEVADTSSSPSTWPPLPEPGRVYVEVVAREEHINNNAHFSSFSSSSSSTVTSAFGCGSETEAQVGTRRLDVPGEVAIGAVVL
ncbi:hypothetical protein V1514DRAFT_328310 [Lipomyces japonicus]|uniref:uncharacterized protein n=1 Tax=Lipomyces japonicus TaxID=56871 RepID=UPI0034CFD14C